MDWVEIQNCKWCESVLTSRDSKWSLSRGTIFEKDKWGNNRPKTGNSDVYSYLNDLIRFVSSLKVCNLAAKYTNGIWIFDSSHS